MFGSGRTSGSKRQDYHKRAPGGRPRAGEGVVEATVLQVLCQTQPPNRRPLLFHESGCKVCKVYELIERQFMKQDYKA